MKVISIMLFAVLANCCVLAEDEGYYVKSATEFMQKNSDQTKEVEFAKYWKSRCETAAKDADEDEEKFLDRYVYDWMAGRKARFEKDKLTVDDNIQACRLYLIYKNVNWKGEELRKGGRKYVIPGNILKHLTKENLDKFIKADKQEGGEK